MVLDRQGRLAEAEAIYRTIRHAGAVVMSVLRQLLVAPRRRSASIKSFEPPPKRTR